MDEGNDPVYGKIIIGILLHSIQVEKCVSRSPIRLSETYVEKEGMQDADSDCGG